MRTPLIILVLILLVTAIAGFVLLSGQRESSAPPIAHPTAPPGPTTRAAAADKSATASPSTRPAPAPGVAPGTAARPATDALLLYCAANMRAPVQAIVEQYEKETGRRVTLQFGGSGTLLANLKLSGMGDLYIAADASYIDLARRDRLIAETFVLGRQTPVIAVAKGNPRNIKSVDDLTRSDVRVGLANPEAASIGKVSQVMLTQLGKWDAVSSAVRARGVFKPTVSEIATDIRIGTIDAAIVFDSTVKQPDYAASLEMVALPEAVSQSNRQDVMLGVLRTARDATRALHLARYLAARDRGLPVFARMGFEAVEGDAWADRPRVLLFSGAVNRAAIADTIDAFSQREGVELLTVYNGCGILNGQMKLGEKPDMYLTCDESFMAGVDEKFGPAAVVSKADLVVAVQAGNPKKITGIADLARPGLRVGCADERQSSLGALTTRLLRELGLEESVRPNVAVSTPTGDLLVTQMRTGSLDAVIVYNINVNNAKGAIEGIAIDHPMARAVQTVALGRDSANPRLMERMRDALTREESRQRFEKAGFVWKWGAATRPRTDQPPKLDAGAETESMIK